MEAEAEQKDGSKFSRVKLGQKIMSGIVKLQFDHTQILYILYLGLKKSFVWKYY